MRLLSAALGLPLLFAALLLGAPARATSVLWEDFEGYSSFPSQIPLGDPVNVGLPEISEGAKTLWYAGRFETPASPCGDGTLGCDLTVQKFGGSGNNSHVARFEDDGGLMLRVDTTNLQNVILSFDWRTFSASAYDQLVAGYFVGDIAAAVFGSDRTADFLSGPNAWSHWTELTRQGRHDAFTHQQYVLPSNVGPIWIAFWLDDEGSDGGSVGDYGKVDNVRISADAKPSVPEPGLGWLGLVGLFAFARRRA
jgi:MYXO-CTERM domain-containing protein